MKKPVARSTQSEPEKHKASRTPRTFTAPAESEIIESLAEEKALRDVVPANQPKRRHFLWRILFGTTGLLISLALGLAAEQLIRDLFARYQWLGWTGLAITAVLVLTAIILAAREISAVFSLKRLDALRVRAADTLANNDASEGRRTIAELEALYAARPDMARARKELDESARDLFDGTDMVRMAEHRFMSPLDARAKALTAASARRVAIVTAISPRALVDVAFVAYESFKLARKIAELYGAKPGIIGSWRLAGAILGHLAITGGVALGDSLIQQLVGHGLAAKLSARLGEGLVNGLMTVRVGIAAMRVTRPLPFDAIKQPVVMDFMADLAKIGTKTD